MCPWCPRRSEECFRPPHTQVELQMVVSYSEGAGNRTQVVYPEQTAEGLESDSETQITQKLVYVQS